MAEKSSSFIFPPKPDGNDVWWSARVKLVDKVPSKFNNWSAEDFEKASFRAVPNAIVRHSAFIAPSVVLMPSFVNLAPTLTKAQWLIHGQPSAHAHKLVRTVISQAVLESVAFLNPLQAGPVIIEDNVFIGARSEVAEGVVVEEGSVISMGVFLGASTKIVDRESGEISYGRVPAYSVVVPGTLPGKTPDAPHLACAVIVKRVDAKTRSKTGINDLLRD